MRIGFDFDNTIVDYQVIFLKIAKDLNLILGNNNPKNLIKNYYEIQLKNPEGWKEIQFKVYCELINKINPSKDFLFLISWLIENEHDFFIVSHKTQLIKFKNLKFNLREPAINWIENKIPNFKKSNIFFESTAISKIRKIKLLNLDIFIDDLTSILNHREFPKITKKIMLNNIENSQIKIIQAKNWKEINKIIIHNKF